MLPSVAFALFLYAADIQATRLPSNPLITVKSSPTLGTNVNGPSLIRVPNFVRNPLGRYYLYFADHRGPLIHLAYADSIAGPWKIHDPGVLHVSETAFGRPLPDPAGPGMPYSHVASPDVKIDAKRKKIVIWYHGFWTEGKPWPADRQKASAFLKDNHYGQFTQAAESSDGLRFTPLAPITRYSYLRVFDHAGTRYAMARLGQLFRASEPLAKFEAGPNPFRDGPYADRVRHVALLQRGSRLYVFFSALGDAPERILVSTIELKGDWNEWKASPPSELLTATASYECAALPVMKSKAGDAEEPVHELRDPAIFEEGGKVYLLYSICGEQGIAAAELTLP